MRTESLTVSAADGTPLHITVYAATTEKNPGPVGPKDIVLLHGWPNDGAIWAPLAQAMLTAAGGYRLIAPDFRGFGGSSGTASGFDCQTFAGDAVRVAESLGLTDWALIGHSMGGKIAQLAASMQPAGLKALALLAPAPLVAAAPTPEEKKATQRAAYGDREKTREIVFGMMAHTASGDAIDSLVEQGMRASASGWNGWIDGMRDEDFTAQLARIAVPTLVLAGAKDPLRTEEGLRRDVADHIAGAQMETLPNVGHLLHVEDPDTLAVALVNFLEPITRSVAATGG